MDAGNDTDIYKGLRALSEASFPRQCTTCGKRFETVEAFIRATQTVREGNSGLKSALSETDAPIVELFRNCTCGSTLMDCFNDRRDMSPAGLKRRALFDQLLNLITSKGVKRSLARTELLKVLNGENSSLLQKMGIKTRNSSS
ncbi:MAG: oxidoreductase [Desulfatitalea sp.]|nr:hypothetical protein [Desulfatitalea sp.]NNJ98912.1 oxidoreductase [Desulfatitalea sp.]